LTSTLVGGEWSASRSCRLNPGERDPDSLWTGGWVGPRTGLDDKKKRNFLLLSGLELRPHGRPSRKSVTIQTTLTRLTNNNNNNNNNNNINNFSVLPGVFVISQIRILIVIKVIIKIIIIIAGVTTTTTTLYT
jgi:hypothetical protein